MLDRPVVETIINNRPLNLGRANPISSEITGMGGREGWFALLAEIAITLTVGTGTGAISEGELNFIPNITFATDVDKESHNAAARALYRLAHFERRSAPLKDAIAASNGTYRVAVPLMFYDEMSLNPFESILDVSRYKSAELNITLGSVADLLTTPGTASATAALTLSVIKTRGPLSEALRPVVYPQYRQLAQTPYGNLKTALPRQPDLRLRRLYWMNSTSFVTGVPFSGTPADDSIRDISIEHQAGYEFKFLQRQQLAEDFAAYFGVTRPAGWYGLDFMKDGDFDNSFLTDPNSVSSLDMTWKTDSGTAAMVNPIINGAQALKPIR